MPSEAPAPIELPAEVWSRPDVLDMCRRRDAGALLRLANSSKFKISQTRLAYWIDTEPGVVNKMINGKSGAVVRLDKWERIADALNMPDNARLELGLAPLLSATRSELDVQTCCPPIIGALQGTSDSSRVVIDDGDMESLFASLRDLLVSFRKSAGFTQRQLADRTGYSRSAIGVMETDCRADRTGGEGFWRRCDDVLGADGVLYRAYRQIAEARDYRRREQARRDDQERQLRVDGYRASSGLSSSNEKFEAIDRRSLLRTAGVAGGLAVSYGALSRLSDAIGSGSLYSAGLSDGSPFRSEKLVGLRRRLETHWRLYQSGIYKPILAQLPDLLSALDSWEPSNHVEAVVHELRSRAYQLAASLSYKFGETTLGLIAAERGMSAAGRTGDVLLGGVALTRLTHGLRNSGQVDRAIDLTLRGAAAVEESGPLDDPARASVYGALLLHSAMASARNGDGSTARSLLGEAALAARHSGESNYYYTAFGPTNVAVWGVGVLNRLGDAPAALTTASTVALELLPVAERKGAFLVDHATAFVNHGQRDEQAVELLLTAEVVAPDEVYERTGSRLLVEELLHRAGPTWSEPLRALNERMGAAT